MIKFKYRKANGTITDRTGIIVTRPSDHYGILDISELDEDEQALISTLFKEYSAKKAALIAKLDADYDVAGLIKGYYKTFLPNGISEVTIVED